MKRNGYMLKSLALLIVLGFVASVTLFVGGGGFAVAQTIEAESENMIITTGATEAEAQEAQGDGSEVLFEDVSSDKKEEQVDLKTELLEKIKKSKDSSIDRMPSLFFTYWQHQSIIDAKNSHGKVRPLTKAQLKAMEEGEEQLVDPGRRYITLGGIVYKAENDWTIWLNGQRVTPEAVPEEVMDLRVYKDYVEFKWLDEFTNSIFPLRLRANQRFNMDMRIFLPG